MNALFHVHVHVHVNVHESVYIHDHDQVHVNDCEHYRFIRLTMGVFMFRIIDCITV